MEFIYSTNYDGTESRKEIEYSIMGEDLDETTILFFDNSLDDDCSSWNICRRILSVRHSQNRIYNYYPRQIR